MCWYVCVYVDIGINLGLTFAGVGKAVLGVVHSYQLIAMTVIILFSQHEKKEEESRRHECTPNKCLVLHSHVGRCQESTR